MTQNALTAAAREGGRVATLSRVTSKDTVTDAVKERLRQGRIDPDLVTIEVTPEDLSSLETGDKVSIAVSIPINKSTWLQWGGILADKDLGTVITYFHE